MTIIYTFTYLHLFIYLYTVSHRSLSWSHQTTGHGSINPCPYSACLQQTVCGLNYASSLEEASFWDDSHADQFDAVCGVWSEHWQADPPLNLCSTHMSISQTQPLDMTLSMCTQLLWSTMARPVLSGTCPVKPLYGLGHRAATQFQGLGNLLIGYAIFM